MLNEEVGSFLISPLSYGFIKNLEKTYEPKVATDSFIDSNFIIGWSKFYEIYNKPKTNLSQDLLIIKTLKLSYNILGKDHIVSFKIYDFNTQILNKTIQIFPTILNRELLLNDKLPQGFSSLSGETLIKGEPRPRTHIHLLSQRDGTKLASTYSDAEGKYKFEGVRKGISYITVAVDPLKEYTTVSQDIKA